MSAWHAVRPRAWHPVVEHVWFTEPTGRRHRRIVGARVSLLVGGWPWIMSGNNPTAIVYPQLAIAAAPVRSLMDWPADLQALYLQARKGSLDLAVWSELHDWLLDHPGGTWQYYLWPDRIAGAVTLLRRIQA